MLRLSLVGGFGGLSLWPYILISKPEQCNYNIEILAFSIRLNLLHGTRLGLGGSCY